MRKHAQVFFFSYGPFIMGDSHSFVASFKIRATSYLVGQRVVVVLGDLHSLTHSITLPTVEVAWHGTLKC